MISSATALRNRSLTERIGIGRYRARDKWIGNQIWPQIVSWRVWRTSSKVGKISGDLSEVKSPKFDMDELAHSTQAEDLLKELGMSS